MLKTAKDFAKKPKKYFVELNKNISLQNITYNKKLLEKAYYFSLNRHNNQYRESGEPFVSHPYAVANILIELKCKHMFHKKCLDESFFRGNKECPLCRENIKISNII